MLKKSIYVLLTLLAIALASRGLDYWESRKYIVAVISPASLYLLPPNEYPKENSVIATLSPGVTIRVLKVRYGKDFETLQVETIEHQTGWVISGEGIKVMSRGS